MIGKVKHEKPEFTCMDENEGQWKAPFHPFCILLLDGWATVCTAMRLLNTNCKADKIWMTKLCMCKKLLFSQKEGGGRGCQTRLSVLSEFQPQVSKLYSSPANDNYWWQAVREDRMKVRLKISENCLMPRVSWSSNKNLEHYQSWLPWFCIKTTTTADIKNMRTAVRTYFQLSCLASMSREASSLVEESVISSFNSLNIKSPETFSSWKWTTETTVSQQS